MKVLIFICFSFLLSFQVKAQKLDEYKAINGITYKPDDTVQIAKGSGGNAEFLYLRLTGFAAAMTYNAYKGYDQLNMNRSFQNTYAVIKKIKMEGFKGQKKAVFTVVLSGHSRADLIIDDAIEACEVSPCISNAQPELGVADELLKLKQLLDSGAITQAEYDVQKKKLLNN